MIKKLGITKIIINITFLIILVFTSFYIFGSIYQKDNLIKKNINELENIDKEMESLIFSGDKDLQSHYQTFNIQNKTNQEKNKTNNIKLNETLSGELNNIDSELLDDTQLYSNSIENSGGDIEKIKKLKEEYSKAIFKGNYKLQLNLLEKIYEETKQNELVEIIFNKALDTFNYEKALEYLKILHNQKHKITNDDAKIYIFVMINASTLNNKNIDYILKVVDNFQKSGIINQKEVNFYKLLMELSKLNFEQFEKDLGDLEFDETNNIIIDMRMSKKNFESFQDSPKYFFYQLIAFNLFKNGFLSIGEKISIEVAKQDNLYILPKQILAYSYFIKNNFEKSQEYFNKLIEIDSENSEKYKFFIGINYFWNNKYKNCITYLSQIKQGNYYKDTLRYLILSYYYINDEKNMIKSFDKLLEEKYLNEYDYYTFFDIIFYQNFSNGEKYTLFNENTKLVLKYILLCKNEIKKDNYICHYGKAGYYLAKGLEKNSLNELLILTEYFKRNYIYEKIGDIYEKLGDHKNAKKYYILSIVYTENNEKKEKLNQKVIDLILNSNKK